MAVEDLGLALSRVMCFMGPDDWIHLASTRRGGVEAIHLERDETRLQLISNAGYWLSSSRGHEPPELGDAARQGMLHIVFARLQCWGEDPNQRQRQHPKYTPLHRASTGGHRKVVRLLLASAACVNARDRLGFTALHFAVTHGVGLVADLLEARCDAGCANLQGYTPLHSAAGMGQRDVCTLLLEAGAPVSRNAAGATPADLARRRMERHASSSGRTGLEELVEMLQAAEQALGHGMAAATAEAASPPVAGVVRWTPAAPGHWEGLVSTGATRGLLPPTNSVGSPA